MKLFTQRDRVLISPPMPWKPKLNAIKLQRECDRLTYALVRAREELQTAKRHRAGLEIMLSVRQERVDKLTAQIEQLRTANRRLDDEAEHLAAIIRSEGVAANKSQGTVLAIPRVRETQYPGYEKTQYPAK